MATEMPRGEYSKTHVKLTFFLWCSSGWEAIVRDQTSDGAGSFGPDIGR